MQLGLLIDIQAKIYEYALLASYPPHPVKPYNVTSFCAPTG